MSNFLNNRELAILLWTAILLIWGISQNNIRKSFIKVLKTFAHKKIIFSYIFMFLYISVMIYVFRHFHIWNDLNVKEVIFWVFGEAFVLIVNIDKTREDDYFKKLILGNIKLIVFFEFILNLFVFSLFIEIILVFVLFVLGAMLGVATTKPKYKEVEKLLNSIMGVLGIVYLTIVIREIVLNYSNLVSVGNLVEFLIYPVFTIVFLPFLFVLALFIRYEMLFLRIGFIVKDSKLVSYIKISTLYHFHLNLRGLNLWAKDFHVLDINSRNDVKKEIINLKIKKRIGVYRILGNSTFNNGFLYLVFDTLMNVMKYLNLVELFKFIGIKIFPSNNLNEDKIRNSRIFVDVFIIFKWLYIIYLWVMEISQTWFVLGVWYLLIMNLYTYFYYHLWSSEVLNDPHFSVDRIKRRFMNLFIALTYTVVGFAYLYNIPYYSEFYWEIGYPSVLHSILFSIANSLTSSFDQVIPFTSLGYTLSMVQLFMMFVFIAIIIGGSIPQINSVSPNKEN